MHKLFFISLGVLLTIGSALAAEIHSCSLKGPGIFDASSSIRLTRQVATFKEQSLSVINRAQEMAVLRISSDSEEKLKIEVDYFTHDAYIMMEKLGLETGLTYLMDAPLRGESPVVRQLGKIKITCQWKIRK